MREIVMPKQNRAEDMSELSSMPEPVMATRQPEYVRDEMPAKPKAVKPEPVTDAVKASVEKEKKNVGQKYDHSADTGDDAVDHHAPQIGERFRVPRPADGGSEELEKAVDISHKRLRTGEGEVEHRVHYRQKKRESQKFIRHHQIYPVGYFPPFFNGC